MAPLAIERIVTTRPGAMSDGAGAPDGSTPNAAQMAMPQERTSARRSLCDGAPRTAAAGWPAILTSPLSVILTAVASKPPMAMPASCSVPTPERTAAPSAAAAAGVKRPRLRIVLKGTPSLGSTATHTPVVSVPHAQTGDSDGCRRSASRCRRGAAAAASAGGTGISCTTTGRPFLSTAFQPWPEPGATGSNGFGLGSLSGI